MMENPISSEVCKKCAECCRHFPFVELSRNEACEIEKLTGLPLDSFTDRKDAAVEEYFLQFRENGDCVFLLENNGAFSCRVYASRAAICRKYPSKPSQKKVCAANRAMIQSKPKARR
jgi:Fe-S-cluster containining protein